MQSVPVSPPPITITFFPRASIYCLSVQLESSKLFVLRKRKSIAKCTPSPCLPGISRSLGTVAPVASSMQSLDSSKFLKDSELGPEPPTSLFVTKLYSLFHEFFTRLSTIDLSSFILGMPYIKSPPIRSSRSCTVTLCPSQFN